MAKTSAITSLAPSRGSEPPAPVIETRIHRVRGLRVMLDADLAELYQVETKALNRAVKRNPTRFPADFMIRLTSDESQSLRCHFGTSNARGGRRYLPYGFTEHGVAMLSSVLNSRRAIQMNIQIIRAFIKLRDAVATHKELAHSIEGLERKQKNQEAVITLVAKEVRDLDFKVKTEFEALRATNKRKRRPGFIIPEEHPVA